MTAPPCIRCVHYSVGRGDACFRHIVPDPVRGTRTLPRSAYAERAARWLWFGKDRCGPEGQHFTPRPPMPPPNSGSAVAKPARPTR